MALQIAKVNQPNVSWTQLGVLNIISLCWYLLKVIGIIPKGVIQLNRYNFQPHKAAYFLEQKAKRGNDGQCGAFH